MNDMMNTTGMPSMTSASWGWDYGFTAIWGLHILSVVAFFTGVILLVVLAAKTFTPRQLKAWSVWLIVAGTVACLVTIAVIGRPWTERHYGNANMKGMQMMHMGRMMQMMMDHNEGAGGEAQGEHGDMMQMMRMMMGSQMGGMMNGDGDGASNALKDEHHESSSSQ